MSETEKARFSISTANWTYFAVTAVLVVLVYLPGGSPGHFLLGLAVLSLRLFFLVLVPLGAGWMLYHTGSGSNRLANAAFAVAVTFWFLDAVYMLVHHG